MILADVILSLAAAYAGLGLLFALYFITRGAARVDPAAQGAPIGFRLLILPGSIALWPALWLRCIRAGDKDRQS